VPTLSLSAQCGDTVQAVNLDATLVVNHRIALDAEGVPERVVATQDGRHADLTGWHQGPGSEEVYYEALNRDGSGSHGWVDGLSRKLVQSG
jgi:hypothetical protein